MKPGTGALFQDTAKTRFLDWTRARYDGMKRRPAIKKMGGLNFNLEGFREHVLLALGGHYDGVLVCRYCNRPMPIEEATADHERPLSRAGSSGMENIGFPCQLCNQAKGSMYPEEFLTLKEFLRREIPFAETDVLGRLAKANKLAAGAARNRIMIAKVREAGNWPSKKDAKEEPF